MSSSDGEEEGDNTDGFVVEGQRLVGRAEFTARMEVQLQQREQGSDDAEGPWRLCECHKIAEIKTLLDSGDPDRAHAVYQDTISTSALILPAFSVIRAGFFTVDLSVRSHLRQEGKNVLPAEDYYDTFMETMAALHTSHRSAMGILPGAA